MGEYVPEIHYVMETSAKDSTNVEEAFFCLANELKVICVFPYESIQIKFLMNEEQGKGTILESQNDTFMQRQSTTLRQVQQCKYYCTFDFFVSYNKSSQELGKQLEFIRNSLLTRTENSMDKYISLNNKKLTMHIVLFDFYFQNRQSATLSNEPTITDNNNTPITLSNDTKSIRNKCNCQGLTKEWQG